jgi:putative spermidine/putrescine transport system permease protein
MAGIPMNGMAGIPLIGPGRRWMLAWPLWPQGLLFAAFFVAPVAVIALASLHSSSGAWTAANYTAFALDPYNRTVILRTLLIGIATTAVTLVLGYPLARAIARGRPSLRWLLSGLVFFPLLTSSVIRSFGWLVLLADNGIFNNALTFVGLPRTHLIFNAYGVTIALAQVLLPFMVLSLVSAMANIDVSIEEAASTLGSPPLRRFFRVTLPMLVPGILAGSLLVFAIAISAFVTPALMGGPRAEVMATLIYTNATQVGNLGLASAASLILLGLTLAIVTLYYRVVLSSHHGAAGQPT